MNGLIILKKTSMVGNGPMEMKLLEKQENSKNMLKLVSSNQFSFV